MSEVLEGNGEPDSATIVLIAKSSGGGTYEVTVTFDGGRISAHCTCKAAIMGNLCKHRVGLLAGDADMLADAEQVSDMRRIVEWAKQAGIAQICRDIEEADRELANAQAKVKKLKSTVTQRIK